ncbi:MAG: AMP-binding protein [Phaeodactylibacter sp.]|nr:AMP-binding protein [Phaeodactylibacter sp.]MCB9273424.1 AMP-binding protein [Lewinellaceae bacterium]
MTLKTITAHFYHWEKTTPDAVFLRQPFGNRWEETTWQEAGQTARRLATGLRSLGLPDGANIGIVSKNCREWIIADLAIMMGGYVSVPFFPTLRADQIRQVLGLGDVQALFVGKLEDWEDMQHGIPETMPVITFPHYEGNSKVDRGEQWHDFINRFEPIAGEPSADIESLWTIIYTSGTTGTPKGVMLTYRKVAELLKEEHQHRLLNIEAGNNFLFSYLPLNHIAERALTEVLGIVYNAQISFVENMDTFSRNIQAVQPTLFFAVPRIWTKFQLGVLERMPQSRLNLLLRIPILSSLVRKKIQQGLGLGRARIKLTAAAPMPDSLKAWYARMGIHIQEIYGSTETCGGFVMTRAGEQTIGTVGRAFPGSDMKIDPANGEVLARGPWFMDGYYNNPEKTAEAFTDDGYYRMGDSGTIDADGYLRLTGRVSEVFKTAKGKFVVPAPIEWEFASNSDIEQICVTGLGLAQPIALVVLSELGRAKEPKAIEQSLHESLQAVNRKLANYEKIATMVITRELWSVENGLLTPTLKVKRIELDNRYGAHFERWSEVSETVVWEK